MIKIKIGLRISIVVTKLYYLFDLGWPTHLAELTDKKQPAPFLCPPSQYSNQLQYQPLHQIHRIYLALAQATLKICQPSCFFL